MIDLTQTDPNYYYDIAINNENDIDKYFAHLTHAANLGHDLAIYKLYTHYREEYNNHQEYTPELIDYYVTTSTNDDYSFSVNYCGILIHLELIDSDETPMNYYKRSANKNNIFGLINSNENIHTYFSKLKKNNYIGCKANELCFYGDMAATGFYVITHNSKRILKFYELSANMNFQLALEKLLLSIIRYNMLHFYTNEQLEGFCNKAMANYSNDNNSNTISPYILTAIYYILANIYIKSNIASKHNEALKMFKHVIKDREYTHLRKKILKSIYCICEQYKNTNIYCLEFINMLNSADMDKEGTKLINKIINFNSRDNQLNDSLCNDIYELCI